MKSSEIRQQFIEYFTKQGHQAVESSSLVPSDDPTLLFTNAGMVPFKKTFLGLNPLAYQRATSSQLCVRAGGKHNDLDNVGYTARHHTFFEMLGNFSFGDYFKREAIRYAWDFLTQVLKLAPERLWITVFENDDEAAGIWLKEMKVSPERFSRCGEKDNFWSMGDTGPCGPCTEIFYDHGPEIAGGPPGSPDADGDRYIEIWNLVFMQFNRDKEGNLHPLPKPSVDTGMGLERIAAVMQGVHSNYDIDIFRELIQTIQKMVPEGDPQHPSLRVIADHIRACSFLITDGVLPSNEGRGYVLRRIIRRAIRHGNKLGLPSPFFSTLVQPLCEVMGEAYPKLVVARSHVEQVLNLEESQFCRTLEQGLRLLQEQIAKLENNVIPGTMAFKLYDTYGFPLDLTQDIAREYHLTVDMAGFEQSMQQQRELSQCANQFNVDYSPTCQLNEVSNFHGYQLNSMLAGIQTLLVNNERVEKIKAGDKASIVLEDTPFYAESGGQVGDKGIIKGEQSLFAVQDTKRQGQAIVHTGEVLEGELSIGEQVNAEVEVNRREAIRLNHTATHLLHAALKKILGAHVQQKGSLVDAERARFDFSHFESLAAEQVSAIENLVNEQIRQNNEVITEVMSIEKAKESGAVALFGEKYGDSVRVLSVGEFSKELCGGTHASRTGDIGVFKIVAEYGVASGVRRIEMVTGHYAIKWINDQLSILDAIALRLKTSSGAALEKLNQLVEESKQQEKEIQRIKNHLLNQSSQSMAQEFEKIGDVAILIKQLDTADTQILRNTLDQIKSTVEKAVIVLYSVNADKINIIAGLSKNLLGKMPKASELVKQLCGKGGGRDDMAQGGGEVPADFQERLRGLKEMLRNACKND